MRGIFIFKKKLFWNLVFELRYRVFLSKTVIWNQNTAHLIIFVPLTASEILMLGVGKYPIYRVGESKCVYYLGLKIVLLWHHSYKSRR